ncbi:twin transmembrane helix small protein [Asticcacaulis sp. AC402]|uniref:twin transmembrane helix small protein n=1 Tax=Asticcacaulis sp. AC402 TaxID=1282361 RepID=UPI0003C3BFD4|nr:twin transmembrane helix small protein [Asticcacaulis sp. AC402]ESQ76097.1 hypothetical protein ABAC402_06520 [Asticcacaulis sp. AC402]
MRVSISDKTAFATAGPQQFAQFEGGSFMDILLTVLIAVSLLAVVATFVIGMFAFARNGKEAGALLNRMMAWRVKTQVVAIAVLLISMWLKTRTSGV